MRRVVVPVLLLAFSACSSPAPSQVHEDGGSQQDAGPTVDAGMELTLPDQPTLQQLSDWWDGKIACRLYSCEQRVRETDATCALARAAEGAPYDTFRTQLASVAAGRATYDAAAGARCATFLKSVDLTRECFGQGVLSFRDRYGYGFVTSCLDLITGTVGQGAACDNDFECVAGAGCVFDRTPECTGQCIVWLQRGVNCAERPQDCAPGNYCDGTVCKDRMLLNNGSACYDDGASCKSGKCFDYQCKDVSGLNGECVQEGDCSQGLYCKPLPPSTGLLGICKAPATTGQPCGYLDHCSGNQSCDGYFWAYAGGWMGGTCGDKPNDVDGTCVPIATGYDYGDTGCFNDLTCDPATSKCAEAPAVGAPCAMPGSRCGFLQWCDANGTCQAKKRPGESALGPAECRDQYDSYEKKCYRQSDQARCGLH